MSIKKTHEMFVNEVRELYGDEYEILSEYKYAKEKVRIKHICTTEFDATPTNLLTGHAKCPKCSNRKRYTYEDMVDLAEKRGYELITKEYHGVYDKIEFICNKHPEEGIQTSTYHKLIYSEGCCNKCGYERSSKKQLQNISIDQLREEFAEKNLILCENEYKGVKAKYLCTCPKHRDHFFYVIYDNLKLRSSIGCDLCYDEYKESLGEKKVREYLEKNNINYVPQKEFDGLVGIGGGNLSYDFFIPQYNILIEYQGAQHERYIEYFCNGDEEIFERQLEHDRRKRKYAEDNNYLLLEIWYYDYDNVESILESTFNKLGVLF